MLDLDAGVHLDEVRLPGRVDEELERADAAVAEALRGIDGVALDPAAELLVDRDGRRLFDHLLVAPLDRALALAAADRLAAVVDQDLCLDVPDALEVAFEVEAVVTEARLRLAAGLLPEALEVARRLGLAHPAPATARARLQHDRVADGLGDAQRLARRLHRALGAGDDRQPGAPHRRARRRLVVESREHLRWRADEDQAVLLADLGEVGVLGEEAIARVDRLRAGDERGRDDRRDVQIGVARVRRADADRLVGGVDREAVRVGLAVHDDALDLELAARADDAERDLTPVRDEDLVEQERGPPSTSRHPTRSPSARRGGSVSRDR